MRRAAPLVLLLAPVALAGPLPEGLGRSEPDRFEVLDLSVAKGFAVVKLVEHTAPFDESEGTVDCGYGGMTANPTLGVTLALWDLGAGALAETHVVYAAVGMLEDCTSPEASATALAAAKAAAVARGLDVTRKPATVKAASDGSFALEVRWSERRGLLACVSTRMST